MNPTQFLDAILEKLPLGRSKPDEIAFRPAGVLTLGAEIELQVIDPKTMRLASRAEEVLNQAHNFDKLKPEFYLSTVEIITDKCENVQQIERDFSESLDRLGPLGQQAGLGFATTGCHPISRYADCVITPTPRYYELIERSQWLTRRMTVYGLHVHIGVSSGDECIRFNNFFMHFMPHLLALSASSPFWQGDDTGMAACRPTTYEALPTAGLPYLVRNWKEFEHLYHTLIKCNAIKSMKDLWWDMRPSPALGTLEIRVCDGPATLAEAMAIVAYIHALAHWFTTHGSWVDEVPAPPRWLARENKWRVMRYGLDAEMIVNLEGETKPIREDIHEWLTKIEEEAVKMGYAPYMATLREILERGNSAMRQRTVFEQTGSLEEVVRHNMAEFRLRHPIWDISAKTDEHIRDSAA